MRVSLFVGTELVFSPFYHPKSNAYVERFHQDYNAFVWDETQLTDHTAVQRQSQCFFPLYRQSGHHSALGGRSPQAVHADYPARLLPVDFCLPSGKLPLTVGKVHFLRKVRKDQTIRILNLDWQVLSAKPDQGVWATIDFTLQGATLRVYNVAPDMGKRTCLVSHPFLLKEPVQPLQPVFRQPLLHKLSLRSITQALSHQVATLFSTMS